LGSAIDGTLAPKSRRRSHSHIVWNGANNPTTDGQYATTGTFTPAATGALTVNLDDSWTGQSESTGIRLNAFELAEVPEPSTFALATFGLLGLLGFGRRRT